jgi:excisionase family DNA binding protein
MSEKIAYSAKEVAELLSLSVVTVRRHTALGWFPHHRIGRAVRYTRADIESYLTRWECRNSHY